MYSQTDSTKRSAPTKKKATGIKALIMATSLAVTLGGWGILAVGQAGNAVAAGQQTQQTLSATNLTSQNNTRTVGSSSSVSQSSVSTSRPNAVARTRSSR